MRMHTGMRLLMGHMTDALARHDIRTCTPCKDRMACLALAVLLCLPVADMCDNCHKVGEATTLSLNALTARYPCRRLTNTLRGGA